MDVSGAPVQGGTRFRPHTKVSLSSSLLRTARSGSSNRDHSKGFHYGDWNAELYSEVLAGAKEPSQGSEVSKDQ